MKHAPLLIVVVITSSVLAAEGQVYVQSDPKGAEVLLKVVDNDKKEDLKSLGKTPSLIKLPEGRNMVTLRLAKYKDFETEIDIAGTAIVKPEPYKLELMTYPVDVIWLEDGWEITVDKTPQTKDEKPITAPATVPVLEGKHDIILTKDGFEPMTKSVVLKDAKEKVTADFSAEKPKKAVKKAVSQSGPMDLMKIANVKDSINGEWELNNGVLTSPGAGATKLVFKYSPPEEYIFNATVERVNGNNSLVVCLIIEGKQFETVIDGWDSKISGIEVISGKGASENATRYKGNQVLGIKPSQVQIVVRKSLIEVNVNGHKITNWRPEPEKLSLSTDWIIPQKDLIYVGSFNTSFKFTKLEVEPLK